MFAVSPRLFTKFKKTAVVAHDGWRQRLQGPDGGRRAPRRLVVKSDKIQNGRTILQND
jgi:hypothetical protein